VDDVHRTGQELGLATTERRKQGGTTSPPDNQCSLTKKHCTFSIRLLHWPLSTSYVTSHLTRCSAPRSMYRIHMLSRGQMLTYVIQTYAGVKFQPPYFHCPLTFMLRLLRPISNEGDTECYAELRNVFWCVRLPAFLNIVFWQLLLLSDTAHDVFSEESIFVNRSLQKWKWSRLNPKSHMR